MKILNLQVCKIKIKTIDFGLRSYFEMQLTLSYVLLYVLL
jgi:hypothetical protein